jgi:hypothetical protein
MFTTGVDAIHVEILATLGNHFGCAVDKHRISLDITRMHAAK